MILPFKTVDILAECGPYQSTIKEEAKKRRLGFVGFLDPRTYQLPEETLRHVFPLLKEKRVVLETDTFESAREKLSNDMRVYALVFQFLDISPDDAAKEKWLEDKLGMRSGTKVGLRGMVQAGVRSWNDFEVKWPRLGEEMKKQRAYVASAEFGRMMNYLNLCSAWKIKPRETRVFYDALAGLLGFNYLMRGTMPSATVLKRLKEKGFPLTGEQLTRYVQILHYGYRYLITTDPQEREKILGFAHDAENGEMVAVRALRASEIHTWEELMGHSVDTGQTRSSEEKTKIVQIIQERTVPKEAAKQSSFVAFPRSEAETFGEALGVLTVGAERLLNQLEIYETELARLAEENRRKDEIIEELEGQSRKKDLIVNELEQRAQQTEMTNLESFLAFLEGFAYKREKYVKVILPVVNEIKEYQRRERSAIEQLKKALPSKKNLPTGAPLDFEFHPRFWSDISILPKHIQEDVIKALTMIADSDFRRKFHGSLKTKAFKGKLDDVTPTGSDESRAGLHYRITHDQARENGNQSKKFWIYRVLKKSDVD